MTTSRLMAKSADEIEQVLESACEAAFGALDFGTT